MMMPFEWDVRVFLEGSHGGRVHVGNDRLGHHGLHHYAGLNSKVFTDTASCQWASAFA